MQHFHRQKIREKKRKKKPFHLELFKQVFNITKYFHKLISTTWLHKSNISRNKASKLLIFYFYLTHRIMMYASLKWKLPQISAVWKLTQFSNCFKIVYSLAGQIYIGYGLQWHWFIEGHLSVSMTGANTERKSRHQWWEKCPN